jgi:chemotaxis protein methyltransferase CheR
MSEDSYLHNLSHSASLNEEHRDEIAKLVQTHTGIQLPPAKHQLIEGRIRKRLRILGFADFSEYFEYLFESGQQHSDEFRHLIDALTTNKTDFFREPDHFELLTDKILPEWQNRGAATQRPFRIWCAGCATGEEPYTLAMVLSEYASQHPGFKFHIIATDISHSALRYARMAIYPKERIEVIPKLLRQKYLLRSRDHRSEEVRMTPEIRNQVQFGHLNFMDQKYRLPKKQDVVFCRNVLIYFEKAVQERVIIRLCAESKPGGALFLGHSESIHNMDVPLSLIAPTSYTIKG